MIASEMHEGYLSLSLALAAVILPSVTLGCSQGDGIPRYRVSGTVTFGGNPVPAGMIYFNPDMKKGNNGPPGFAEISAGRFDTASKGSRHVIAGAHEVVIEGHDPGPANGVSEASGRRLFGGYRVPLDLPAAASQHTFEVPAEASRQMAN